MFSHLVNRNFSLPHSSNSGNSSSSNNTQTSNRCCNFHCWIVQRLNIFLKQWQLIGTAEIMLHVSLQANIIKIYIIFVGRILTIICEFSINFVFSFFQHFIESNEWKNEKFVCRHTNLWMTSTCVRFLVFHLIFY